KLPADQQNKARQLGLLLALVSRIALLLSIKWVMSLTQPFINLSEVFGISNPSWQLYLTLSGRDLILLLGGLFLIYKSTTEIHHRLEGVEEDQEIKTKNITFGNVIFQIIILDVVFSLDSVITAVGMVDEIGVMVAAIVIAVV